MSRLFIILLLMLPAVVRGNDAKFPFGRGGLNIPSQPEEIHLSPRTVELLSEQWSSQPTAALRADMVADLGRTRSAEAVPAILGAFRHSDAVVRSEAARCASLIDDARLVSALREAMHDPSSAVRREVVVAAAARGAGDIISGALIDGSEEVRLAAIARASSHDVTRLIELAASSSPRIQCRAVNRLGDLPADVPGQLFLELLQASHPTLVRAAAMDAMAKRKLPVDESAMQFVRQAQDDELKQAYARWMLSAGTGEQRHRAASLLLAESDAALREYGINLIAASPSAEYLPELRTQLETGRIVLHQPVIDAMLAIGGGDRVSVEKIAGEWLAHSNWQVRIVGSSILGVLKSTASLQQHLALLHDGEKRVVESAVTSLASVDSEEVRTALVSLLKDLSANVESLRSSSDPLPARIASAAFLSAGTARVKEALPSCRAVISQKSAAPATVRAAAVWAFGMLSDAQSADDRESISAIISFADDALEDEQVRFESVKALGNLRAAGARQSLQTLANPSQGNALAWMAHQSLARLNNQPQPFIPAGAVYEPRLSLRALDGSETGSSAGIELNAVLAGGTGYLSDRWTAIRCAVTNPTSESFSGDVMVTPFNAKSLPRTCAAIDIPARSRREIIVYAVLPEGLSAAEAAARGPDESAAIVELVSRSGAAVARTRLGGQPFAVPDAGAEAGSLRLMLYANGSTAAGDPYSLAREWGRIVQSPVTAMPAGLESLPRDPLSLDGVSVMVLEDFDPDALDLSQRDTVQEFVRRGGVVLLAGNQASADSWLTEMLPIAAADKARVQVGDGIATVNRILPTNDSRISSAARGFLVAQPSAAGRIIASSIRLTDLAAMNQLSSLQASLPGAGMAPLPELSTQQIARIADVLPAMIGTPVLSWGIAAGLTGGYVLLSVLVLSLFGRHVRPRMFLAATVFAAMLSLGMYAAATARQGKEDIAAARIQILDCSTAGNVQRVDEVAAMTGATDAAIMVQPAPPVMLRTIAADNSAILPIRLNPTRVTPLTLRRGQIDCAYHGRALTSDLSGCKATVSFHAKGATLAINNAGDMPIVSPLLLVGSNVMRLRDIPLADTLLQPGTRNVPGDFTNPGPIASERSQLQGEILRAISSDQSMHAANALPVIVGWLENARSNLLQASGADIAVNKRETAVRIPVEIQAGLPGEQMRIDACFNRLLFPEGGGLASATGPGWISTAQTGDWLIRIDPPAQLGSLEIRSVDLRVDLFAPSHILEVRRGLCSAGTLDGARTGELLSTWTASDGVRELRFECTHGDFDSAGRVYLRLSLRASDGASPTNAWQVRDFQADLSAVSRENSP